MAARWCVNFDEMPVLQHGLQQRMWLMQYQYSHGGHAFQGHRHQIGATSKNWSILREVKAGDWLVAYLRHSRFYAIGEVIEPRERSSTAEHGDTVERTVQAHSHQFLDGIVRYLDAPVLFEDFTDQWRCPVAPAAKEQPPAWRYPQRIDVREWEHVVPDGIRIGGLNAAAPRPAYRHAAFKIPEWFFERIATELRDARLRGPR